MSSPNHSTSDIEDAFSSMNILNYTSVSPDYFPASSGSSSFNSSENSTDNMIPPVFSSFYNNPCLKDVQAFYAKESPISSPDPITPPAILTSSPIFEIGKCSVKMHLKHHEEQIEDILNYLDELYLHRIERMEEGRINGNELKTELKEIRTQIIKLQKKRMPPKRTSTSIADLTTAEEAQTAVIASASNPNNFTGTPAMNTRNYKEFISCQPFCFNGNDLTKKGITMAKPNEYIFVTQKKLLSNNNEGRMVEKSFLEIQGMFLVKIRDNTCNGIIGENVFKHIDNFLKVVGPLKIIGISQVQIRLSVFPISLAGAADVWFKKDCIGSVTTWGNLVETFIQKFYQLSDDNEEMEADEDDDLDDIAKIFKIKGNLFDNETPLCKAFNEFNYLLKIDTDLFTFDIQGIKTYEEYELNNNTMRDLEEPWPDNGLKEESLMHKAILEESWGDATPEVMTFYAWLKNSFENFHELDYEVLLKLEECRWKVNSHENAPFTCWENHGQGPYANAKTKMAYDPYLDINRIFGRNYEANNTSNTQLNQEYKKENHDPLVCNVRRFEMMKYSFDVEDEYVAIKEHEHSDHSRTNVEACQVYRELFRIMDEGWLMTKAKEE
ncbi:hypothetical protein Tco_1420453 [Tanacetum coccineum]